MPYDGLTWTAQRAADAAKVAELTSVERLREREAHYRKRAEEAE